MSIDLNIVIVCVTVLLAVRMVTAKWAEPAVATPESEPSVEPDIEPGPVAEKVADLVLSESSLDGDLSKMTDEQLAREWMKIENRAKAPHSESPIERKQKLALELYNRDKDRRGRENL